MGDLLNRYSTRYERSSPCRNQVECTLTVSGSFLLQLSLSADPSSRSIVRPEPSKDFGQPDVRSTLVNRSESPDIVSLVRFSPHLSFLAPTAPNVCYTTFHQCWTCYIPHSTVLKLLLDNYFNDAGSTASVVCPKRSMSTCSNFIYIPGPRYIPLIRILQPGLSTIPPLNSRLR